MPERAVAIDACLNIVYTNDIMQATIQKWGNSLGIRIPSFIAKDLALKNGSSVEILEEDNRIIIQASKRKTLKEILELVNEENIHAEQFGIPAGKELL